MKVFKKLWQIMFYSGISKKEYAGIRCEIRKHNHKRFQSFSFVAIVFLSIMVVIAYTNKKLNANYWNYLVPLIILVLMLLADVWFASEHPYVCKAFIYVFISMLAVLAIAIGTFENKEQTAGTFLAFLLVIPLLFVMRPIENVVYITFFDILFIIASGAVKERALFEVDMINAIVFGCISIIISTYMTTVSVENFVMKDALLHLAETDQLTQLPNRTCYERNLQNYPTVCQINLACIYVDINGLHELNEQKGHYAGDIMLQYVADSLKEQFGHLHTYRIGGDEFVVFSVDTDSQTLEEKIKRFEQKLNENSYYASVGYEIQDVDSIDVYRLVKAAEDKMYLAKQKFYGQNTITRCRNLDKALNG